MKKVFGQTVRDLKRGVNKKVLKLPGIEQKILDATNNEPWGPHGTHLAELAQATRNNHEYQLIMAVIWRRINDTGKKWRHVFKALTVLEYLVAHGSERVIGEIREHGYQISALAEFQYIDSSGRDQGINVRKKSQSLVALVNDKDRIQEIRQKAQANEDKYAIPSAGNKADEWNGYRDDERYGRGRNSDELYGRDAYRDDSYRGRGNDVNHFRSRSRSVDGYADRPFGDDDHHSSRSGSSKADDQSQDERGFEPPSYQEAIRNSQDTVQDERDVETVADSTQDLSSAAALKSTSPAKSPVQSVENSMAGESVASRSDTVDTSDEFDPRGSVSASQPAASCPELDIFGLSASDSADPLALMPANSITCQSDMLTNSVFGADFVVAPSSASTASSQTNDDPFGDAPFKAIPQENVQVQPQHLQHVTSFEPSGSMGYSETLPSAHQKVEPFSSFDFGDALGGLSYPPTAVNGQHASASPSFLATEFHAEQSNDDILDSILPRTGSALLFSSQEAQPAAPVDAQTTQTNPFETSDLAAPVVAHGSLPNTPTNQMNSFQVSGVLAPVAAQGSSERTETAEMNPFHSLGLSTLVASQELPTNTQNFFPPSSLPTVAASQEPKTNLFHQQPAQAASQGSPINMPSSQMNFFQPSGPSVPAASQGQGTDMKTAQINFPQPSALPVQASSQGSQSDMQTSQMNFSQQSGLSVPAASQGSPTNMHTFETNFFQPSGLSASAAPQGSQTNMQTAQMNLFQPPGLSTPAALQGLHPNMQTDQLKFLQPSVSQGSQTHMQIVQPNFLAPLGLPASTASQGPQTNIQTSQTNFLQQSGLSAPVSSQASQYAAITNMQAVQPVPSANIQTHVGPVSAGPTAKPHMSKEKFETKSAVWADTLNRGLVNLDISGPKTNPLADIGVDFDAINRKEKRLGPKSSAPPATSTIIMGKAMGSGSGIGHSAASGLAPPLNPMVGSGMGMGGMGMNMGMGGSGGMGMGGSGGMGMGMGMRGPGMGMGGYGGNMYQPPMGMNMGMNMGQGAPMQPPGPGMPGGGYNPMMGMGGYSSQHQQPYGGGYR